MSIGTLRGSIHVGELTSNCCHNHVDLLFLLRLLSISATVPSAPRFVISFFFLLFSFLVFFFSPFVVSAPRCVSARISHVRQRLTYFFSFSRALPQVQCWCAKLSFLCRCNVPLHHRSGPRLEPLPRYPQPAPRAKLSVRLSISRYVNVPFFSHCRYILHYVTVPIVSIIPRFYCTRPIVFS